MKTRCCLVIAGRRGKGSGKPGEMCWEFELVSLDTTRPDVKVWAKEMNLAISDRQACRLALLNEQGEVADTLELTLGADKTLNAQSLAAFMRKYELPTRDAETMLAAGMAQAKAENKRVFLIFSGSWCAPCRLLGRFLAAHKAEFLKHFVFVKLDTSRDLHSQEIVAKIKDNTGASGGVPWYVILDASGKSLITSNAADLEQAGEGQTNIGFPHAPVGFDHFIKMIKTTVPGITPEALAELRKGLEKKP